MIASVKFEEPLVITVALATELKLRHTTGERTGVSIGDPNGRRQPLHHSDYDVNDPGLTYDGEKDTFSCGGAVILKYYLYQNVSTEYAVIAGGTHLVDLEWFVTKCKIPFTVVEAVNERSSGEGLHSILEDIECKMGRLINGLNRANFNEKCNVHVGGGLIAQFNELSIVEDACTDRLQGSLNDGWRIIAACVQPDQRRPDYVIGRYNPHLNIPDTKGAER